MRQRRMTGLAAFVMTAALLAGVGTIESLAELVPVGTAGENAAAESTAGEPVKPAPGEFAHITTCAIGGDGQIAVEGSVEGTWSDPAFYDNYLYLFELKPYEDDLAGRSDYIGWITKGDALSFRVPLNLGTADDRLYSKFVVAVFDGQEYTQVSNTAYVTNPEAVAKHRDAYRMAQNKKGLLIETTPGMVADAFELGVNHVNINIPFNRLLGSGIDYTYDGKTYHFNKDLVSTYDTVIRRMSEKSMTVTAILLNDWNEGTPQLIYPGVTKQAAGRALYYGFNASTEEGYETIKAIASFLAERYSSMATPYGKVSNWVIGNEVNNQYWNYMGEMELDQYVKEYERAFRVFYTAIKSTSQNDRLFFSTDYYWNSASPDGPYSYPARQFIDRFADLAGAGGPMDWGLAYHPYPVPMTEPEFWDDDQTGKVTGDISTPILNLKNLQVLTDHMQEAQLRQADGSVRHIILSEQGFTSTSATRGEDQNLQAAAIAYAYYIIDSNPYIDAFIMSRQVDAPPEVAASQSYGLWKCDMNKPNDIVATTRKKSWEVYKNIDIRTRTLETTEFAKEIIGISSWSDVIPNFKWKRQETGR